MCKYLSFKVILGDPCERVVWPSKGYDPQVENHCVDGSSSTGGLVCFPYEYTFGCSMSLEFSSVNTAYQDLKSDKHWVL